MSHPEPTAYCSSVPDADHTGCPSSVECYVVTITVPEPGDQFPGEHTDAEHLQIGYPYEGDASMADLDGMTFYPERIGPIEYDPADPTVGFFPATVTVGVERWEVLLPEDSTARLQAPVDAP